MQSPRDVRSSANSNAALIPLPVLFYLYGHKIRAKSTFATEYLPAVQAVNDEERDHLE